MLKRGTYASRTGSLTAADSIILVEVRFRDFKSGPYVSILALDDVPRQLLGANLRTRDLHQIRASALFLLSFWTSYDPLSIKSSINISNTGLSRSFAENRVEPIVLGRNIPCVKAPA